MRSGLDRGNQANIVHESAVAPYLSIENSDNLDRFLSAVVHNP
jgi:hypothetical protein